MLRITAFTGLGLGLIVGACSPPIPEGRFACDQDGDCPSGWFCRTDQRCYSTLTPADAAVDSGPRDPGSDDAGVGDSGPSDAGACGDGTCDEGESCETCRDDCGRCSTCGTRGCSGDEDCGSGHLEDGEDKDPCDPLHVDQWRCVWAESHQDTVSQVCRKKDGKWQWVSMHTNPRNCAACVCTMTAACCREGSDSPGCAE